VRAEISQSKPKEKSGDDLPFFFTMRLKELADGAFAGQTDMDETLLDLE
jgi:hypothetical protein